MDEAKAFWGTPLFVFSGGEPLLYRSEGHGVLDAVQKHPDSLFLMFTNGTRIDESVARRLERLGNLTPALSVEGLEARTDERRGKGRFARTLEAMSLLRRAGVPFGISVTVTGSNMDEILSDRFLDFFFIEQGAFYGFVFHYMPIGREAGLDRMPTPAQRVEIWKRTWEAIETKRIFLFDFWNHGPMVGGCLSAGREGGYLYIDWNGRVMPCVFAPYAVARLQEVYARGETLEDVWRAPLLRAIRDWQREYGYDGDLVPRREGNWLRPCPVRDHYPLFREWLDRYRPEPENEAARAAWKSGAYLEGMSAYGAELKDLTDAIWEDVYVHR
jgi:MoaA/NifB/PqqE/SkfB family radical SAM enzyme